MQYYPSPGGSDERVHLYLGLWSTEGVDGRVMGVAAESEDIRARVVSFAQAMHMLETGKIDNAASIITLQWLAMNKASLQQQP